VTGAGSAADGPVVPSCRACGSAVTQTYCERCGEARLCAGRAPRDGPRAWLRRLHASLQALASPPGRLTRDWNDGCRSPYLSPLSLLLWTNVAFFLVQAASGISILSWPLQIHVNNDILGLGVPLLAWRRLHGASPEPAFTAAFEALESVHAKSLVVLMVPLLAAVGWLAAGARQRFAAWLAFAAHFFTYALIALSALFPVVALSLGVLARAGLRPSADTMDAVVSTLEVLLVGWYLYRALGTLGVGASASRRLLRAALLVVALAGILRLYHLAVFAVTLAAV
jgi:hypothetical protein